MIEEAKTIKEYNNAVQDEEKFLCQQAKIEWLSDGDKNSRFFHVVLKGKNHRNIIDMVYDEKRERFKGSDVAEQFVKHFQSFLKTAYHVEALPPNSLTVTKVTERDADNMEDKNNTNSSSGWKKLLSLRDKIKKHVKCEVGNSKTIFLWHDKCIPVPTLRDEDDKTYWMTKDGKKVKWSINKMWDDWK
nr:hypothetical protein [Tanacetum cinerariifolium]